MILDAFADFDLNAIDHALGGRGGAGHKGTDNSASFTATACVTVFLEGLANGISDAIFSA